MRATPVLTPFERSLVLGLCPRGSRIVRARWFRHHAYPCPVRVTVRLPSGSSHDLVVRSVRHRRGSLARETALYPVLARLGLPVPRVLAGPVADPRRPGRPPVAVLTLLPGETLQRIAERGGAALRRARDLLVEAVTWMHRLTPRVASSPAGRRVPRGGLAHHLAAILRKRGPWQREPEFQAAAARLGRALARDRTPLVFSNGDYQPANFLSDGARLTGFLDFEHAWFEDPLYGFAKYPIYDLHPLHGAGVVDAFLRRTGRTRADFAPRLALGCLATLSRELPVAGGNRRYRAHVLNLLRDTLKRL
jgi:aminoglycoside phosphotransferase (APT) family kinase protein